MADPIDPYSNYNFLIVITGITSAAFQQCTGLDSSIEVIDYREGGDKYFPNRKLPGKATFGNITLKRGFTDNTELYDWHQKCLKGEVPFDRRTITIQLQDRAGNLKKTWVVTRAWPAKWTGPNFNAEAHEVAIESLEFAHEGVDIPPS
jgi:phage tail-like protein